MNGKLILLVEDNPDDEELTRLAFSKCKIENHITIVRDGAEAVEYLSGRGKSAKMGGQHRPDLILLDLKLPKIGGLEVLETLRSNPDTRLIPVVVLTSSSEMKDIIASYQLGANSYVRKPLEFREFADMINLLSEYWLILNQSPPPQY